MTLRNMMLLALLANLVGFAALFSAIREEGKAQAAVSEAYQRRYQTYLPADELRQSSVDLTRFARAYADTADPQYRNDYLTIAAIRDGKEPRSGEYSNVFWDVLAAPGNRTGPAIPLVALIDKQGVTPEEKALLEIAKKRSDDLMRFEMRAFREVGGAKGDPSTAARQNTAIQMLYSPEYVEAKRNIMEPILQFRESLNRRTAGAVATAESNARTWHRVLLAAQLIILTTFVLSALALVTRVLAPISRMCRSMQNVASGNELASIPALSQRDEIGDMARALVRFRATMRRKNELEAAMAREAVERVRATERVIRHFTDVIAASIMNIPPPRPLPPARERESGAIEELTIFLADMAETVGEVAAKARSTGDGARSEPLGPNGADQNAIPGKQRPRCPARVLVIDDEIDITDALEISLQRLGYTVTAFNDPKAALGAFLEGSSKWDIVILDELMPGMRGSDLAARIKEVDPSIPIVLVSGSTHGDAWVTSGAIDMRLDKPLGTLELDAHIQEFVTRS